MDNKTIHNELLKKICTDRKIRVQISRESHEWFFHLYFSHYIEFPTAPFQREIIDLCEDNNQKMTVIMAFRGSAKSTIVTQSSVIWSIIGKLQKKMVLILTETQQQARIHLGSIKQELEGNGLLINDFGFFDSNNDEWAALSLSLPKYRARIVAASSEQKIRGMKFMENRPDLVVIDDIQDDASTKTLESRNKVYDWLTKEVMPIGSEKTKFMVIGNMVHSDSLVMRLINEMNQGKRDGIYRIYPLIDEDGRVLWPSRFPDSESIERFKKTIVDTRAWRQEFLLQKITEENQVIDPSLIKQYGSIMENEV